MSSDLKPDLKPDPAPDPAPDFKPAGPPAVDTTRIEARASQHINEYLAFVNSEYNLTPEYARLIPIVLMRSTPHYPIWIVFETNRHPFWQDLDWALTQLNLPRTESVHLLKSTNDWNYARTSSAIYNWLTDRDAYPRIFTDTQADKQLHLNRHVKRGHPYYDLAMECLRSRLPIEYTRDTDENTKVELLHHLKLVLNRNSRISPIRLDMGDFYKRVYIAAQTLSADVYYGPHVWENLCLWPSLSASMYGRVQLQAEDQTNLKTLLRGILPQRYYPILRWFSENVLSVKSQRARYLRLPTKHKLADVTELGAMQTGIRLGELRKAGVMRVVKYRMPGEKRWYGGKPYTGWMPTKELGEFFCNIEFSEGYLPELQTST